MHVCMCLLFHILKCLHLTDSGGAERLTGVERVGEDIHVNDNIVWLSRIKTLPQGCCIHSTNKSI